MNLLSILIVIGLTTTIGNYFNYNKWEEIVIKTTTNGIPMVGVEYNKWELARLRF